MKGYFITLEGGEGSGKTTQLAILGHYLEAKGYTIVRTREPGGTKIGDALRSFLLHPPTPDSGIHQLVDPKTELFLYLASRAQHIREVILPALIEGKIVLCDRFTDATIAYQGDGRGLPKRAVERMARFAAQIGKSNDTPLQPDLTFLLDVEVKKGLSRLKGRDEINRIDRETLQFHEAVRRGYLSLARRNRRRIHLINTDAGIEATSARVREVIDALLS
ncbi:MAG: dTMP kinase [Nitrospiria bacterium]